MIRNLPVFIIGLTFVCFFSTARADGGVEDLERLIRQPGAIPAENLSSEKEAGTLRLTLDKNVLIRLDQDASSVIVNNPDHVSVMLDSPRLLIVVPHLPGSTSFTVLNMKGETVLQKDVLVSGNAPKEYVRIRRMCSSSDASCVPAAYYYCPDGCYEVTPVTPAGGDIPAPAGAAINAAAGLAPSNASTSGNGGGASATPPDDTPAPIEDAPEEGKKE